MAEKEEQLLMKITNCPICAETEIHQFLKCTDTTVSKKEFAITICDNCGFKFTNPIPTKDQIGAYYKSEDYISHTGNNKGLINKMYNLVSKRTIVNKFKLIQSLSSDTTLLDIGCGRGAFLNYVTQQGWVTLGIEPGESAKDYCEKELKLKVNSPEDLFNIPHKSFDVITMWHVLEHVHELNLYIKTIKEILKPDGILIIAVPNPDSYDARYYKNNWAAYDLPRHLYHFSKNNINKLMQNHNLIVQQILPMKYDSYYVSMLSEKNKNGNIFSGFFRGFISNIKSSKKNPNNSSLIYIIKNKPF